MATTAEEMYAAEAKKRMSEGGKKGGKESGKSRRGEKNEGGGKSATPFAKDKNRARSKAAKATGASARSVQDAKALKKADPELAWW